MMSRASLVRCSCPWRVNPIFPMTHRPCLTSSWVMSTVSEIQRATGCGPGSAKRSPRIVRGRPPAISIALRQSQMDIFDFILLSRDRFYQAGGLVLPPLGNSPAAVPPFFLVNSGLPDRPGAVQGAKRHSGPLAARTDLEQFAVRERRSIPHQCQSPARQKRTPLRGCSKPSRRDK